jgi:hypothetical protein
MTIKQTLIGISMLVLSFISTAHAQWGDPMAGMDQLMYEHQQWNMQLNQYDQQMELYIQQQMQMAQQNVDQAYANMQQFFINYYRQNTGDYTTADAQAMQLGDRLYCQHNPAQCQQNIQNAQTWSDISAAGHQQNMNNIDAWGNTMNQVAQSDSSILDMQQTGYMNNAQLQYQGQQKMVQEGIHGTTTFVDPYTNTAYTGLPVNAYDGMLVQTPYGQNAMFHQASQSWYLLDAYGNAVQQLQYGF